MFRNILVGIDGSRSSQQALRHSVDIATATRGRLGLLSVAPRVAAWYLAAPFAVPFSRSQMDAELEAEAERNLERAAEAVPCDVPVTKLLARGRPAEVVLTHALDGSWDLIVIGHRPGLLPWPPGQRVGARLMRSSPVPVLIVRAEPTTSTVPAAPRAPAQAKATSPTRIGSASPV
jgi:nucleotide-binding universal stress UspA family protein